VTNRWDRRRVGVDEPAGIKPGPQQALSIEDQKMLVTPAKWQHAKEDRDHEEIMRRDHEAFRAFQRGERSYQRLRTVYFVCFCGMAVLTLVFLIVVMK